MKVVIAQMKHETNTFSPVPTPLARFSRNAGMPECGSAAYAALRGTGSAMAAFFDLAERNGAEMVIPIAASAWPSGPVDDDAFEYIAEKICAAVADGCDAVLLDLHGAMVTRSVEDGDGELVSRLRRLAPRLPIGVAFDMHANISARMVESSNVVAGYQTYPHIDALETGLRAAKPIFAMLRGDAAPAIAWGNRPMLPHVMRQSTDDSPNRELQARCREMEAEGALAATVFVGFPHADVRHAGLSAVVVTDADPGLARRCCDELLEAAWKQREAFVYRGETLDCAIHRAKQLTEGPVVILDHCDNAASGGTMDSMTVLGAIIDAGLDNVAAFAICDPDAVNTMLQAGIGARITLPLGGKADMPAIGEKGEPRVISGIVKRITDGRFRNRGPMSRGEQMDMGPSVVFDTGRVDIVVISRHQEPNDYACLESVGIDAASKRYLMLKSRVHWRAGFRSIARTIVECAGAGVCTSDYGMLRFNRVRRPIYPLDAVDR